jgi:hypothetical protein
LSNVDELTIFSEELCEYRDWELPDIIYYHLSKVRELNCPFYNMDIKGIPTNIN